MAVIGDTAPTSTLTDVLVRSEAHTGRVSAPKAAHDEMYGKWCRWSAAVERELIIGHHHQEMWTEVRDAATKRFPNADHTWLASYSNVYDDAQMALIRRVTDVDPQHTTASLTRLVRSIRDNPTIMTRTRYCALAESNGTTSREEAAADWDALYASPEEPEYLNPRMTADDDASLTSGKLEDIIQNAHKTVAHLDAAVALAILEQRPPELASITFGDIRAALAELAVTANRYHLLLNRNQLHTWTPYTPPPWMEPLGASLFPLDPSAHPFFHNSFS